MNRVPSVNRVSSVVGVGSVAGRGVAQTSPRAGKARWRVGVGMLAAGLAVGTGLGFAPSTARGQTAIAEVADPVAKYSRPSTNAVLVLDLSQIDLDKLVEYGTAKAKASGVAQADIDKGLAEIKPQLEQVKGGMAQFKQSGVGKIYALVNVTGAMAGDFGVVVIPTGSAESAKNVSGMIKGMVDADGTGSGPATVSTAGNTVVIGSKPSLAEKAAPNLALAKALAGPGAGEAAALRLVVDAKVFQQFHGDAKPEDKAILESLVSLALSANVPPKTAFSLSVTAKDSAAAQKLADKFGGELSKGKSDPKAEEAMGKELTAKLYKALTPKVEGSTVTVALDTKTIEEVIVPAVAKAAAAEQKQAGGAGAKPPAEK